MQSDSYGTEVKATPSDVMQIYKELLGKTANQGECEYYVGQGYSIAALLKAVWRSSECHQHTNEQQFSGKYGIGEIGAGDLTYQLVFDVQMQDVISRAARKGDFLWEEERQYLSLFEPGFLLDVGANIGGISMLANQMGWEGFCIEASKKNFMCLNKSILLNQANFTSGCYAVSNYTGTLEFLQNGPWGTAGNAIVDVDLEHFMQTFADPMTIEVVPCYKLDDFSMPETGLSEIKSITLIKMDIEGSEYLALQGMKSFLEHYDYPPIYAEVNGYNLFTFQLTPVKLIRAFELLGYWPYKLCSGQLQRYSIETFQREIFDNYLFLHQSYDGLPERVEEILCAENFDDTIVYIADVLTNGWHQHKIHILNSLQDYFCLVAHPRINDILRKIKCSDKLDVVQIALSWL